MSTCSGTGSLVAEWIWRHGIKQGRQELPHTVARNDATRPLMFVH